MITTTIPYVIASDEESCRYPISDLQNFQSWSGWAWQRIAPTWIEARPVNRLSDFRTDQAVHLLLLRDDNDHESIVCVYPVSSLLATCNINCKGPKIALQVRRATAGSPAVAVVIGRASEAGHSVHLVRQVVLAARAWLGRVNEHEIKGFPPFPRDGPFDRVGFCTWSSLGEDIHPNRTNMKTLFQALTKQQLPVQTFLLDDGWHNQRTYAKGDAGQFRSKTGPEQDRGTWQLRGLWDFDCNGGLGENGLRWVVDEAKKSFAMVEGVRNSVEVGVWLALTGGYWDGVHPNSPLIERYHCQPYHVNRNRLPGIPNLPFTPGYLPNGKGVYYLPPPAESLRFWTDWFILLRENGVQFIKVDNQGSLSFLEGAEGLTCQNALWKNMVIAADQVFGRGRVIHCMSHHESMYGGPQGLGIEIERERFVWRTSDDFGLVGKRDNFQQMHIFTNITNAILSSSLSMVLDADMFMTAKLDPIPHALLRSIFPGPLLLSDHPGEHDLALLWRMIALDKSGTAKVIKTEHPAIPLPSRVLDTSIMGTGVGRGCWASVTAGQGHIIAVWNVRDDETKAKVEDTLTMSDILDMAGKDRFQDSWIIARQNLSDGGFLAARSTEDRTDTIDNISLDRMGAASYWAIPTFRVLGYSMGVLGIIHHFAGLVTIDSICATNVELAFRLSVRGTLGLIVDTERRPSLSATIDGTLKSMSFTALPGFDTVESSKSHWLGTVDVGAESASDGQKYWSIIIRPA